MTSCLPETTGGLGDTLKGRFHHDEKRWILGQPLTVGFVFEMKRDRLLREVPRRIPYTIVNGPRDGARRVANNAGGRET